MFLGKFEAGVPHGDIEITHQTYSDVGNIRKGVVEGKGSIRYSSGDLYEGCF